MPTPLNQIAGNASEDRKTSVPEILNTLVSGETNFAPNVGGRIRFTDMDELDDPVEPTRKVYRTICEMDVEAGKHIIEVATFCRRRLTDIAFFKICATLVGASTVVAQRI